MSKRPECVRVLGFAGFSTVIFLENGFDVARIWFSIAPFQERRYSITEWQPQRGGMFIEIGGPHHTKPQRGDMSIAG